MDTRLSEAFSFTDADLQINRQGFLSEEQLNTLKNDSAETQMVFRFILILFPLIALGFFLMSEIKLWVLLFLSIELLAVFLYRYVNRQSKELFETRKLRVLQGKIERLLVYPKNRYGQEIRSATPKYYIQMGLEKFFVSKVQFDAFYGSNAYTLYVAQGRIMSAEADNRLLFASNN